MPIYRAQCGLAAHSPDARDRFVITPHFNDRGISSDPDGLARDLAEGLAQVLGFSGEIKVAMYDAQGLPPNYPKGEHVFQPGQVWAGAGMREAALCLSFYSEHNRPRNRGRLYIPAALTAAGTSGTRPPIGSVQTQFQALVSLFAGLGGADVDWVVYSRRDNQAKKVSNWWCDNEWDVQRSRGLRPTSRISGTTSG
jgi:hypothetical protein